MKDPKGFFGLSLQEGDWEWNSVVYNDPIIHWFSRNI